MNPLMSQLLAIDPLLLCAIWLLILLLLSPWIGFMSKRGQTKIVFGLRLNALHALSIILLLCTANVMAADKVNTEQDYRNNVQWAKDAIGQNQSKAGYSQFNVNDLCKDAACKQDVANPTQSRYHNNPSSMTGDAQRYSGSNEQSQAVTSAFNKGRPTINPNDGAYHAAVGYQNDAYNISHGISSKYHDCDKGLRCDVSSVARTCSLPSNTPVQCYITPKVTIDDSSATVTFPFGNDDVNSPDFEFNTRVLTHDTRRVTKITIKGQYSNLELGGLPPYKSAPIYADGTLIKNVPLTFVRAEPMRKHYTINATFDFDAPITRLHFTTGVFISFTGTATLIFGDKKANVTYQNSCRALLPECQQVTSQCVEGKETRIINGVSVTQDCWKEQKTYHCNTANTCTSLSACAIQSTTCKTQLAGVCIEHTQTRLCETQQCQDVGLICGEDSFSLSGDYYEPDAQRSTDFNQAAAGLAAVGEAGQDLKDATNINEDSEIIFKGEAMRCSIKAAGISNCCKDSGWGNSIGIASCSEEEKALGTAKEDKLTVSLGRYCAEKVLGVCIREKKAYCTFGSKLARIVQEAGRGQLNMDFGSAKHPDCRAFSPNELQKIDMSQMDFSDFYEDLHDGMITPDVSEIQNRLQQSVKQGGR